jgi:hypothetical protein
MRSSWWCRDVVALTLLVLAAASGPSPAAQTLPTLFDETRVTAAPAVAADRGPIRRARRLRVDPAALAAVLDPAAARPVPRLNLFADVRLALVRERLESSRQGHRTWVGHADGDAESTIALTWDGVYLSGGVVAGGVAYDVSGDAAGVVVSERAFAAPAAELPSPDLPSPPAANGSFQQDLSADGSTAAIDILVIYTPAARTRAGGVSAIQSQLANAVALTNTAFQRSGVNAVLTTVGLQEVPYAEAAGGLSADLSAISPGGTLSATMEAMRTSTGADLVALVTGRSSSSGGCGVAWLGPSSGYGFSVTEQACQYAGQWTFSHELGHNFGARHAAGDSSDTSPACPSYACGYRQGSIRTLMAYYVSGAATSRILNYSSATVREPAVTGEPTGSSLQDNARRLAETAGVVAAYRAAVPSATAPEPPRAFTAVVAGSSVTLSWLPPAGGSAVTGYELEVGSSAGAANLLRSMVAASPLPVAGVPTGTYYVRVRSLGPGGRSAPTADVVVAVGGCAAPGPITLSGSQAAGVVSLRWSAAAGSGPMVYYLGAGSGPGALDRGVFAMGAAQSYAAAVPPGTYYVKAAAANPCGIGPVSNEVRITVP